MFQNGLSWIWVFKSWTSFKSCKTNPESLKNVTFEQFVLKHAILKIGLHPMTFFDNEFNRIAYFFIFFYFFTNKEDNRGEGGQHGNWIIKKVKRHVMRTS